ncbi:MAG: MurR/RpiR family transcriptional regulator [Paracoccus sp. (in: a-proteobacteria)]|uniref:MurR/RpiR family transcriptional regulator n=1 Tax=Paracoccus sp. TaxID=267 RepID=UPI0039E2CE11
MQLRELLSSGQVALTPAETRIVQALLNDFPGAGLGTAASLAKRAGVSDPTVSRLVAKLGFDGFTAFQTRLIDEVEERLRSPLVMMRSRALSEPMETPPAYLESALAALDEARISVPLETYDRAARMILEARSVLLVGGRFSGFLAGILAAYLVQFRAGITSIGEPTRSDLDRLVDLGRRDLVIGFDYRRYQRDVVEFLAQSAGTEARIILFTDRWQSPAASHASLSFTCPVEVSSPYDSMVPALAQLEALVAHIIDTNDRLRARVMHIERIRRHNRVTEDD